MALDGLYFSGKRSTGHAVMLDRAGDYLRISGADVAPLEVLIKDIQVEPPLAGMARHLTLPSGAAVEMADTPELRSWFSHTGFIERTADWLERRWPIALASLCVTAAALWAIYIFVLPATATLIAYNMPQSWQDKVADGSISILRQVGLSESDVPFERQQAIRTAFAPLVAQLSDSERYRLEFRQFRAVGPNAFALPGGRMVVLDGLIELTDDDEEIVAVLAHELGHAYHRHALRNMVHSGVLAALVSVAVGDVSGFATLPVIGLQAAHSRKFEREADRFALSALRRADISPAALARIFEKLRDAVGVSGNSAGIFATHPALNERIMKANAAAGIAGEKQDQASDR